MISRARLATVLVIVATGAAVVVAPAAAASPDCAPGDRLETGLQGEIPQEDRISGRSVEGYFCNLREVGFFPGTSFANFDTYRNCAYYSDTLGLYSAEGGTIVLDVSDPRNPVQTDYLTDRATENPGESLRVNQRRGLLVADRYVIPRFGPGGQSLSDPDSARSISVYDVKRDCSRPHLLADDTMPDAIGHEGCFQPDGMVYYMASTATITPIDLTDPTNPKQLSAPKDWTIHGCSISDDGKRGYFADIGEERMLVADTSEVQARKPGATMSEIGEYATPDNGGQQSTIPVTYDGRPYLIDWSEYRGFAERCIPGEKGRANFGYPVILDMADETKPRLVSKLLTEVMLTKNCARVVTQYFPVTEGLSAGDIFPLGGSQVFLYDSHYCSTDRLHDPTILACSNFGSGIRVYDIRDPAAPTEIAYFNPGTATGPAGTPVANAAFARPVIRSDLAQIWFADLAKGFHVIQFRKGVWPFRNQDPCPARDYYLEQYDLGYSGCRAHRDQVVQLPSSRPCRTRTELTVGLRPPPGEEIESLRIEVSGGPDRILRGRRLSPYTTVRGLPAEGAYEIRAVATLAGGREVTRTRRYRTCVPGPKPPAASAAAAVEPVELARISNYCRIVGAHVVRASGER